MKNLKIIICMMMASVSLYVHASEDGLERSMLNYETHKQQKTELVTISHPHSMQFSEEQVEYINQLLSQSLKSKNNDSDLKLKVVDQQSVIDKK